ncbi:MAG: WecB/TagA/CpsF family glycosyltransferase [Thermodesulfobacteriota bacterium]|nr:WecB/TagA/CpsF family glycosyltransferase [Thermodesulfobacteriota bacterium]
MKNNDTKDYDREEVKEELYRRFSRRGLWRLRMRRLIRGFTWLFVIQLLSGAKRLLDFLLSLFLLLILWPILVLSYFIPGTTLKRTPRVGRWCVTFNDFSFDTSGGFAGRILTVLRLTRLPVLINILKGDISFIGPRAVSPGDLSLREKEVRSRFDVRPGLISLWWIRRRANIDYATEVEVDQEYVESQSVWGDLGIALRAIPAVLYGEGVATAPDLVTILGIPINNVTMADAIETIIEMLNGDAGSQICFVNADCANIAYRNKAYLNVLKTSQMCLADGIGLKLAGKILVREIKQNVNGTDLFPLLCEALSGSGKGLFLLGARHEVPEAVRDWIKKHYPGVIVSGCRHGYFSPEEEKGVIDQIAESGADLLLVAFGAPRQDTWINDHLMETGVRVAMGVGGLFDFYSGRTARAPMWMREMGMEWIYRFIQEPGRLWKRYFVGNAVFLYRVILERIRGTNF